MNIKIFCRCSWFPSWLGKGLISTPVCMYRGADKSLARPTPRCILFDSENISFDASLIILVYIQYCINNTYIPPIMIINRVYEHQNLLSLQLVSFLVGLRTYQQPCTSPGLYGNCLHSGTDCTFQVLLCVVNCRSVFGFSRRLLCISDTKDS